MAIHFVLGYFDEKKVQKIFCDIIYEFSVLLIMLMHPGWIKLKNVYILICIYYIILYYNILIYISYLQKTVYYK